MGSGGSKKTTQTYRPAPYIESGAQQSAALATQYASTPWQSYDRNKRVADLSTNEQAGIDLAAKSYGTGTGTLDKARGVLDSAGTSFADADISSYMNPYIKGALDPAAREMRIQAAQRQNDTTAQEASVGALSGSRAELRRSQNDKTADQGLSDLYATGYANAFDKGAALWQADQQRKLDVAKSYMDAAGMGEQINSDQYKRLMDSGEVQRSVDQLKKDFDYSQFIEKRDWSGRQALYLADTLRTLKGSYTEKNISKSKSKGNAAGQILGAVGTVAGGILGFIYGGPAGAAAGASVGGQAGSAIGGGS